MNKKGFTLIELIAVLVILSLVIVVVATKGFGAFDKVKTEIDEQNLKTIKDAAEFLMTEVKYCDEDINENLFGIFGIFGDSVAEGESKCDKLQEKATTNTGLEIELIYLLIAEYITNSGVQEISNKKPNLKVRGCLDINGKITIKMPDASGNLELCS